MRCGLQLCVFENRLPGLDVRQLGPSKSARNQRALPSDDPRLRPGICTRYENENRLLYICFFWKADNEAIKFGKSATHSYVFSILIEKDYHFRLHFGVCGGHSSSMPGIVDSVRRASSVKRIGLFGIICLVSQVPFAAHAGREELARQLANATRANHEIRGAEKSLEQEQRSRHEALDDEIAVAETRVRDLGLRMRRDASAKQSSKEEEPSSTDRARLATLERFDGYRSRALRIAKRVRGNIERGIEYRMGERLAETDRCIEKLSAEAREEALEGARCLWALLGNELRLGQSIELQNKPVLLDGDARRVNAYQLRIGRAALAFVSENGSEVGLYGPSGWDTELSEADRLSIRQSVAVLRRQEPPRLLALPFSFASPSPRSDADKGAEGVQ
jgi:hypothetical protein